MVRRFDEAIENRVRQKTLHRVSRYLLGSQPGQLGPEFRAWASAGRMSDRLRTELTAYQLCVLDDSFVEGPHAQVGRIARQTTKPSPSWWSSTLRLEQNFREYDRSVPEASGRFGRLFDSWRLMAQSRPSAYISGKPARVLRRDLLRSVYRTGAAQTQRDWTVLQPLTDKSSEALRAAKPTDKEVLIKEYLLAVFVPGSVVEVSDTRGVSLEELLSGQASEGSGEALVRERRFYQVVSRTLVSKRFVTAEGLARLRRMRVPIVLQRLVPQAPDGQGALLAVPEGVPDARDVMSEGSWQDWRQGMHSWTVDSVTDAGSLRLVDRRSHAELAWTV